MLDKRAYSTERDKPLSRERIYDPTVLEEPGDFTLHIDVSGAYDVKNPDGTNPSASMKVVAPTIRAGLSALALLNEKETGSTTLLANLLAEASTHVPSIQDMTEEELEASDEAFQKIGEAFNATGEWREAVIAVEIDAAQNGETETSEVTITLRAPSYRIMYESCNAATTNKKLNLVAAGMMPYADDYDADEDWDEE